MAWLLIWPVWIYKWFLSTGHNCHWNWLMVMRKKLSIGPPVKDSHRYSPNTMAYHLTLVQGFLSCFFHHSLCHFQKKLCEKSAHKQHLRKKVKPKHFKETKGRNIWNTKPLLTTDDFRVQIRKTWIQNKIWIILIYYRKVGLTAIQANEKANAQFSSLFY